MRHHQGVRGLTTHRGRRSRRSTGNRRTVRNRSVPVVPPVRRRVRTRRIPLHHHLQTHGRPHQHVHIHRLLRDHRRLHQPHRRRHRRHRSVATRRYQHRVVAHILQPNARHPVGRGRRSRNRLTIQEPLVGQRNPSGPTGRHTQRQGRSHHLHRRLRLRRDHRRRSRQPHHDLRRHQTPQTVVQRRFVAAPVVIQQASDRQAAPVHAESRSTRHTQSHPILAPLQRAHCAGHFQRQAHRATQLPQDFLRRCHQQPRRSRCRQPHARTRRGGSRACRIHQAHLIQPVLLPTGVQRRQFQHRGNRSHQVHAIPQPLQLHRFGARVLRTQAVHRAHHSAQDPRLRHPIDHRVGGESHWCRHTGRTHRRHRDVRCSGPGRVHHGQRHLGAVHTASRIGRHHPVGARIAALHIRKIPLPRRRPSDRSPRD